METDQNKYNPHPQAEQTLLKVSSPTQPINKELPQLPDISQFYGDTAFYNSSLQKSDCYNVDFGDFGMMGFGHPDDMSPLNFQVADANWISNSDVASNTYWNMDELWQFRK